MLPKIPQATSSHFIELPRPPVLYICPQCSFSRFVGNRWEGDVLSILPSPDTICPICEVGMKILDIDLQEMQEVLQDITTQDFMILKQICAHNPPIDEFGCPNHQFIDIFNNFSYRFMQKQSRGCHFSSISRIESYEYYCPECEYCQPRKEFNKQSMDFLAMRDIKISPTLCPNCKSVMRVRHKKNIFKTLWNFTKNFGSIPDFSKPVCVYICPSCNIIIPLRPNKHVCKQCGYSESLKNRHKVTIDDITWRCPQCENE